jgi:phosphatidylglycerol---prolipoprotein diacylglyceryl transferase
MLPILQVGPVGIQIPGLVLIAGLWLGLSLAERHAHRYGIKPALLNNLVFIALIAGVIGARFAYVASYPEAFSANPPSVFSLNPGLLDPIGGIAAGLISALIYGQRKKIPARPALDAITPLLAVMLVAFGLTNLASGNGFGAPTSVPWGIDLWGARRHPTQIYETLMAGIILAAIWPKGKTSQEYIPGRSFLIFIALSAAARLFLESFRGDSILLAYGLRSAQLAAWIVLATSLWGLSQQSEEIESSQGD